MLPTGTVTFLFTDIAGSTRLLREDALGYADALAEYRCLLRAAFTAHGGHEVDTQGDAFFVAFPTAGQAAAAAAQGQRSLAAHRWPDRQRVLVRMGLHTGEVMATEDGYVGLSVHQAARIAAAASGGQVVLSEATAALLARALPGGSALRRLGDYRLKDFPQPEVLYQLDIAGLPTDFPPLHTLEVGQRLPSPTGTLLGRGRELAALTSLLTDVETRLVTLTGPGGIGKTRLALEASSDVVAAFRDGVFFVDLSVEHEPEQVFAAIVRTVSLPGVTEDEPLEALRRGLRTARMLLVLDNFEQVAEAATGLSDLLQHCPHLTALVTSRESLRVRGEALFAVPPLSLPERETVTVGEAEASEAVRLFVQRAAAVVTGFGLTDENATDVAAICRLLDGLPLAIELAAARVRLFAVDELRARLDLQLDELRGGPRDLPERQQTLRRAIEWSTELLRDADRAVLSVLSVFAGARLADVEAVIGRVPSLGGLDVVESLGSLVDKNLVRSTQAGDGRPRLSMLNTIRNYAAEQLASWPDVAAAARRAHAEHYTEQARAWGSPSGHADRAEVLAALSLELGNFRAAWSYWVREGAVARLNDLLEPLWGYYDARGNYRGAVELGSDLLAVLSVQPETPERIRDEIAVETSLARSMIAVSGYTAEVERRIRAALDRSDAAGGVPQRFSVLRTVATLHLLRADFERGAAVGRELLALAEQNREPALLADAHLVVGAVATEDLTGSLRHLDESIEHFLEQRTSRVQFRVGPNPGVVAYVVSGLLLWEAGFPDRAEVRIERGIELAGQIGHPYSLAYAYFHASFAALGQQDLARVAEYAGELLRIAEAQDYPIWRALAFVMRGTARIGFGERDEGLADVERGFGLYEGLSTPPVFWSSLLMVRAAGCLMAGQPERGAAFVEEAVSTVWSQGLQDPQLDILWGDLLLASPVADVSAAEELFERAAASAEAYGARMIHLIAATRLATLRRSTPRRDEALADLRAAYDGFTEGFDTPQLVAARALLDGA
ncbi:LuxR family transcriptional regulator [Geodermatophilus arenarius]|uniref:ATP-binding protein n=1 Tax=Geodermatophilus arenarius TaxID=1137990 RepID=A0ABV9LI64_9ACTN